MGAFLGGIFFLLMLLGMPIGLAIGISAFSVLVINDLPFQMVPQMMFMGNNSFALVAVPFFILAGDILAKGGISEKIISFAEATLGRIKGGLSIVSTVASMFIAAISGSGAATTAAVGSALLPDLEEKGYDVDFSAALIAASGTIGVVIPPSVPMVLYAVISGESVAKLFMAGFIPGALMGIGLITLALYVARKRNYPASDPVSFSEKMARFKRSLWGLMTPVIILGGIFSGWFTPSEAAASTLIGLAGGNSIMIYFMIMVIVLISGMFMETASALIILTPIFLPTIAQLGGNLIHFGVLISIGLAIGMATPPVAIDIYVASAITGLSIEEISKPIIPMVLVLIFVLLIVTYLPSITLILPQIFWGGIM